MPLPPTGVSETVCVCVLFSFSTITKRTSEKRRSDLDLLSEIYLSHGPPVVSGFRPNHLLTTGRGTDSTRRDNHSQRDFLRRESGGFCRLGQIANRQMDTPV